MDGVLVYSARPGRPAVVTATLDELTGPVTGVVELPLRLMWCTERRFDLDDPDELLWLYETVLREAIRPADLRRWLHAATLVRLWPALNLPRPVRDAWQAHHPALHG